MTEAEAQIDLNISFSSISSLEGIQSFLNLEILFCADNQLTLLDLSQNLQLTSINCQNNLLTSFIIPKQLDLQYLLCYDNQLTSLDVSNYPNLIRLSCGTNPLQSLDVTHNPILEHLGCGGSQLTNLNITQNPNLKNLFVWENELSSLDFSQNLNLEWVQSHNNLLTSIDVSLNTNLLKFDCFNNQISQLDFSQNPNLTLLYCNNNLLTNFNIRNGNNTILENMSVTENSNLECIQVDDVEYSNNTSTWYKDDWTIYSEDCQLGIDDFVINDFKLYPNPVQEILFIKSQQQIERVSIYNLQGQLINETKNIQIDVSLLSSGIYFVSIIINGKNSINKFIKN